MHYFHQNVNIARHDILTLYNFIDTCNFSLDRVDDFNIKKAIIGGMVAAMATYKDIRLRPTTLMYKYGLTDEDIKSDRLSELLGKVYSDKHRYKNSDYFPENIVLRSRHFIRRIKKSKDDNTILDCYNIVKQYYAKGCHNIKLIKYGSTEFLTTTSLKLIKHNRRYIRVIRNKRIIAEKLFAKLLEKNKTFDQMAELLSKIQNMEDKFRFKINNIFE